MVKGLYTGPHTKLQLACQIPQRNSYLIMAKLSNYPITSFRDDVILCYDDVIPECYATSTPYIRTCKTSAPIKFRDWIESIKKYVLLTEGDDNQSKRLAYQTSRSAVSDYIRKYMAEHQDNSWEQLNLS